MESWLQSLRSPAETQPSPPLSRAVWFRAPREVELREEAVAAPQPGEVRIVALASAISHGTEMLVYRGQVDPELTLDLPTLEGSFGFPIKYGYASVGRVDAVGREVMHLHAGDLVFVRHPHQSQYVAREDWMVAIPSGIDPEAAVFVANLETAINILLDAKPRIGDRVAVLGQGVVGLLVTQLLRRAGVDAIIAIDPTGRRRQLAMLLGAHAASEPGEAARDTVMQVSDRGGADLAIEVSGNPSALDQAIDLVRRDGTVVAASWYGTKPVTLRLGGAFHRNRVRIVSSQVSHLDPALGEGWTRERRTAMALELLREIQWAPLISHRFSIEEAAEAYRLLDQRPEETVQVLFTYV